LSTCKSSFFYRCSLSIFAGLKVRDIELASRAVLPRFYVGDIQRESFEVLEKRERKVVWTANPTVMVGAFVRDYLGGDKLLGTEIEANSKTKKVTGFVKKPGVLVGGLKRLAVVRELR
jgi:glycerol-3-phosphate acyltransferase